MQSKQSLHLYKIQELHSGAHYKNSFRIPMEGNSKSQYVLCLSFSKTTFCAPNTILFCVRRVSLFCNFLISRHWRLSVKSFINVYRWFKIFKCSNLTTLPCTPTAARNVTWTIKQWGEECSWMQSPPCFIVVTVSSIVKDRAVIPPAVPTTIMMRVIQLSL